MSSLNWRLRSNKKDCGPNIDRSCECHYQYTMDEAADVLEFAQEMDAIHKSEAILAEARIESLESTLKSIQKQSGDWCWGKWTDGAAFTIKSIWEECNEALGPTTNEIPVSTNVGSSSVPNKGNDND